MTLPQCSRIRPSWHRQNLGKGMHSWLLGECGRRCELLLSSVQCMPGCQLPMPTPAPLANTPIGRPWEMIAVDILEVPVSYRHNHYLLVIQDSSILTRVAILRVPFSNRGWIRLAYRNLIQRHITHKGMEWLRGSTGHCSRCCGCTFKIRLTGMLFATRTFHLSNSNPFFNRVLPLQTHVWSPCPHICIAWINAFDPNTYQYQLCSTLARLQDFVDAHIAQAAHHQKTQYDQHTRGRSLQVGDSVWLSIPTAGKLDPR